MSAKSEKKLRQAARESGTDKKLLAAQEAAKQAAKSKRRWTAGTIAIAVLIVAVILLNSGLLYKTTAYTVNGEKFSASKMNYYYTDQYNMFVNQYGSYASMFGLDTSNGKIGLDAQPCSMIEGSWKDYFLQNAENVVVQTKVLRDYAAANGITLDEADLAQIETNFDGIGDVAKSMGYANESRYFAAIFGTGVNSAMVRGAYRDSALASKAMTALSESFVYSDEELKEKYDSYNGDEDLYNYSYYYVEAEKAEGEDAEVTEEAVQAAKATADEIVDYYRVTSGEVAGRINAAVSMVIPEQSAYNQSKVKGGSLGDYKAWVTDPARESGDITVVPNSSNTGYYVVAFDSHDDNDYNVVSVRHILLPAEANSEGVYTEEAKAAAKARAEEVLAEFNSGDKTEERFAELANKYSDDSGSNTKGGLYENIYKGEMVPEFDAFCFDAHSYGDTGIVYGQSGNYAGYHVMFYIGEGMNYRDYIAETELRGTATNDWVAEQVAAASTAEGFGMKFVG